jgi:acetyl esterase/lipase
MALWVFETAAPPPTARLAYGPGEFHFGDLRVPEGAGPHPVVIVIHGGFWRARFDLEHIGHVCAALTGQGYATWNIEYRRVGQEGGGWPGTLQDVAMAADYLRAVAPAYDLDLDRVITLGHSAGGHLALWLAARPRLAEGDPLYSSTPLKIKAAISLAGVNDLREGYALHLGDDRTVVERFMGGTPDEFPERYADASPYELLPLSLPQVLIHGTEDQNVPFSISQRYYERASALGDPVQLVILQGVGHFEVIDPHSAEWPSILAEVNKF